MNINEIYLKGQDEAKGYNNPNKIIIHHPEFYGPIESLNDVMRNMGYYMIGYNYYVRKDGTVWKGRPDWATSANCYGQNNCSLGVCFEGNYDKDTEMPVDQFNAGVELIKHLMDKYGISEVNGHKKYINTACPGRYFPLDDMINAIHGEEIESNYNNESEDDFNMTYQNGSTREVVYADSSFTREIGSLDPREQCKAMVVDDNIMVYYNCSLGRKVGFVRWAGGLQE